MMGLDNKGWSLGVMLGFLSVLLIFVVVVSILSYNAGIGKKPENPLYEEELRDIE